MAKKSNAAELLELATRFIAKKQGNWEHEDWEKLVAEAERLGYTMDDPGRRNLGNLLEAGKHFHFAPVARSRKKSEKKEKVKSKEKAAAKESVKVSKSKKSGRSKGESEAETSASAVDSD